VPGIARLTERLDVFATRHRWVQVARAAQRRFSEKRGSNLAAAISMRAFMALFPVVVLTIAVVGFVGGDPQDVAARIAGELGLSGDTEAVLTDAVETAQRTKMASSIVGVLGLLWTGTGLAASLASAWNAVWDIPGGTMRGRLAGFLWLLGGLAFLAVGLLLLAVIAGSDWLTPLGVLGSLAAGTVAFVWTAWLLPTRRIPLRAMLPAAVVGGIGLEILKELGAFVIPQVVERSSALYGTIGAVFALLVWMLVLGWLTIAVMLVERQSWVERIP